MHFASRRGLTLVEWIAAVSIAAILAGALLPRVTRHMAEARDARRIDGARAIVAALERFRADHGRYPAVQGSGAHGGWDVSHDGSFLSELVEAGYLAASPRDPLDGARYHYAYYVHAPGAAGCPGDGPFYVLGIRAFETDVFATRHAAAFRCDERDWSREFAWSTGAGATVE
jgi:prepilin-type N-terminal cleavage/methylation domain-containing protein